MRTSVDSNIENNDLKPAVPSTKKPLVETVTRTQKVLLENLQNSLHHSLDSQNDHQKKKRKISFKIKSNNSSTSITTTTTIRASKVQQLASKFNELILEQPEVARAIRKPSLRPKPNRTVIKRRISVKKSNEYQQLSSTYSSVKATIEIFEQRSNSISEKPPVLIKTKPKSAQDLYDSVKIQKTTPATQLLKIVASEDKLSLPENENIRPNVSFLWRNRNSFTASNYDETVVYKDTDQQENIYDFIDEKLKNEKNSKDSISIHSYESFDHHQNHYEYPKSKQVEDIYETLSVRNDDKVIKTESNENIYSIIKEPYEIMNMNNNKLEMEATYECIYPLKDVKLDNLSTHSSLLSSDQQSNSLYEIFGGGSNNSCSDRSGSDEWVDVSEAEDEVSDFVIVSERQKTKKNAGWSDKVRDQWIKCPKTLEIDDDGLSDVNHYYESLNSDDEFDSFDSESDDEFFSKTNQNDSGVEMGLSQLPNPPVDSNSSAGNIYGLTRLAARLRKNWSLTKNDITKSLSRMTKKKSLSVVQVEETSPRSMSSHMSETVTKPYENIDLTKNNPHINSIGRKKNWLKFRRAVSMGDSTLENLNSESFSQKRSTFYLPNEEAVNPSDKPATPPRRRTSRPLSPPPPAPKVQSNTEKEKRSTSWYTECGLFKATDSHIEQKLQKPKTACWYAEVGLYQNVNNKSIDVADLTKNPEESRAYYNDVKVGSSEKMQIFLRDEPLYQFYDAAVTENALNESVTNSDSDYDGYEEIGGDVSNQVNEKDVKLRTRLRNCRTLWCEIPEVVQSEILRTLTSTQKKIQEAKFEIITSEASYFNSLTVLTDHFISQLNNCDFLNDEDRKVLFADVIPVKLCSEKLLNDLEICWQDSILLPGICKIIQQYCDEHFSVYVDYCANQSMSDAVLRKYRGEINIKGKSPISTRFAETLRRLETSSVCQGLTLHSFLMLPMQRVTRLPLLVDAVYRRLTTSDEEYQECQSALQSLQSLAVRCNEAARKTERRLELQRITAQLEFPPGMTVVDLKPNDAINNRFLVRSGDIIQLISRGGRLSEDGTQTIKMTFGKKFYKEKLFLMVFEDWFIIAKRKTEDALIVQHHCPRNFLEVSTPENSFSETSYLIFLTLLENHEGKQISLLLSCNSETERARWMDALQPTRNTTDSNEIIYESWDRPQVLAVHHYNAAQSDELSLQRGDVVNVDKKMKDGWFFGEKLSDGCSGWFPGNHTQEIVNPHVRARNLRQRYRLLAFTDEYLNYNGSK